MMRRYLLLAASLTILSGCAAPALFVSQPFDSHLYPEPARNSVTFWGHACVYMDVGGVGIVTDPVFDSSYSPLNGRRIPRPPAEAYNQTSIVLISHAHSDHLDPPTLERFPRSAVILCPAPCEKYVRHRGPSVRVMRPGDTFSFPGGTVVAVPALHPGARWIGGKKADGRALGYVIVTPERTIYYSGDTDYFSGIEEVGRRYHPDLAILNVNVHLPPSDAVRAMVALGSDRVIPIHMGAFGGRPWKRGAAYRREFVRLADSVAVPLAVGQGMSLGTLNAYAALRSTPPLTLGPSSHDTLSAHLTARQ
jgi:L-ascorbate metabolism protein UlaG (beta-lactamase superfamily)